MTQHFIFILSILFLFGCAGRSYSVAKADHAYDEIESSGESSAPPPPPPESTNIADKYYTDPALEGDVTRKSSVSTLTSPNISTETPATIREKTDSNTNTGATSTQNKIRRPFVVYSGFLKLRVKTLLDGVAQITELTKEKNGYVESLSQNVVVIRIPAENFEATMKQFSAIGDVLDRRISAQDVTARFTDLNTRLTVAKDTRERLLALLKNVTDVEERLGILQEIKRLSENIESIESTLATLKNLVDYFTITLELESILDNSEESTNHSSPFPWIRDLQAHRTTIFEGSGKISMTIPTDFVLFDESDDYRAQSADTTTLRAGILDNDPKGDNKYWVDAVEHEFKGRGETVVEEGTAGRTAFKVYRNENMQPRYYLVAVHADQNDLYVLEVFYPNQSSFEKHHSNIVAALQTFKGK